VNALLFLEAQGAGACKVKELPHLHTDGYCLCIHGHLNTAIFVVYVTVWKSI
jgi:hypothetical protein